RAADLDIRLVAPDGTTVTLLSDAGGDGRLRGGDLIVVADGGQHPAGLELNALIGPTDHDPDPQWAAVTAPADLDQLVGIDPNGRWQLLVADDQGGASGHLASWALVLG